MGDMGAIFFAPDFSVLLTLCFPFGNMTAVIDPELWARIRANCDVEGACLIWRGGTQSKGYPIIRLPDGSIDLVRRVVARLHGRQLAPGQPLMCACRSRLCVAPQCLKPSTRSAILKRTYRDGKRGGPAEILRREAAMRARAKLTMAAVRELRISDEPTTAAAERLNVAVRTIQAARAGRTWKEPVWRQLMG